VPHVVLGCDGPLGVLGLSVHDPYDHTKLKGGIKLLHLAVMVVAYRTVVTLHLWWWLFYRDWAVIVQHTYPGRGLVFGPEL